MVFFFFNFWLCWVFSSCEGFLQLQQAGATPHRGAGTALHRSARASHYRGPSRCGAQAPDAQAQQLWPTGPAAPRHVGSSQTRARTRVPCISRQTLNHCATREALSCGFISLFLINILKIFLHIKLSPQILKVSIISICFERQSLFLISSTILKIHKLKF